MTPCNVGICTRMHYRFVTSIVCLLVILIFVVALFAAFKRGTVCSYDKFLGNCLTGIVSVGVFWVCCT